MVESQPSKLLVAGSIPVSRSSLRSGERKRPREHRIDGPGHGDGAAAVKAPTSRPVGVPRGLADLSAEARRAKADVAQLAERVLGKDEVTSSILVIGSNLRSHDGDTALVGKLGHWRGHPQCRSRHVV